MASKHNTNPYLSDSTGLLALAQVPPKISLNSPLLASEISLPPHPLIHCWVYTSHNNSDQSNALETARRNLVREHKSLPVTRAILPRVHIAQDSQSSALYTFAISSADAPSQPDAPIFEGTVEGLVCSETYHFTPEGLYPCSAVCSIQPTPCPSCLSAAMEERSSPSWASAGLLPRIPLRRPFAEFIHAVRDRLIEDITQSFKDARSRGISRSAVRYKRGILLSPQHTTSAEWGLGWDHAIRQRSLVYCELQLHLYPSRIVVHPILRSSHMVPLPTEIPSPIAAGAPITLLPNGIPAYYLNTYTGPVGGLTAQFDLALAGLGAGDWKSSPATTKLPNRPHSSTAPHSTNSSPVTPTYIIAWLAVQNRHGEDKGMPIIWPSSLSVVPTPSFPRARPPLSFLPLVPAQLLASPPVPAAKISSYRLASNVLAPPFPLDERATLSPVASSARGSISGPSGQDAALPHSTGVSAAVAPRPLRPSLSRFHTSDSLRAFRSLTIQHKNTKTVTSEVSSYVDAVARDREKERERLRREREGGGMSRAGSGTIKVLEKTPTMKSASSSPRKMQVDTPTLKVEDFPMDLTATSTQNKYAPRPNIQTIAPPKVDHVELAFPTGGILSTAMQVAKPEPPVPLKPDVKEETAPSSNSQTSVPAESSTSNSFDPFSGFDTNWNQSSNDFMGMSMDNYDISMGFSMGINGGGDGGDTFSMDDGFGVFTDDDFNFFDSPATTTKATNTLATSGLTPAVGSAPLSHTNAPSIDGNQTSGPGPPFTATQAQPIPWLKAEGMTPASYGAATPAIALPPDLLPSTPIQTPPSHSAPVTPSVQLADQLQSIHIRRSSVSSSVSSSFDPIPFAQSHKTADGKYALGKFAMATPPPEEEEPVSLGSSGFGWHISYRTATDPRVGIVRRLAGAKRKRLGTDQDEREDKRTAAWLREHEEWASESVPEEPDSDPDAGQSETDLDDDDAMDEDRSRSVSRAHTPPPSYLPLGPSLLQTQFQHQYLLPLCTPLRPPGTDPEAAIGMAAPLMSAPTPVSPAANLGAPSERSKALEGAAQILIKEVVENSVWGEYWQAALLAAQGSCKADNEIWMSDVRAASKLLSSVEGASEPQTIGSTFVADDMQELSSPSLTVAKSDGVIQVLPPALRFWEKLGLYPRAGSKHLTVFTFFEGSDDETETRITEWLDKLSAVYMAKNYGSHTLGRTATCTRDGLVPVTFDPAFRKTLVSFVASLSELEAPMVFYIVTPTKMMNLASSSLRHIFSAMKKVKKTYPDVPILMHLLPEPLILGALHEPALKYGGLEAIVDAVYNRALLPTDRTMSRALLPAGEKARALFSEPAFALTRSTPRKVMFSLEAHPSTLDVADRHYMLHVGYRVSECGKWLFAVCIDQRGDTHDLRAWLVPDDDSDQFVVNNVWDFAMVTAKKAHVEWRVIVSRLGAMPANELHMWTVRLSAAPLENQHLPPIQMQLIVAEFEEPWNFLASKDSASHRRPVTPNRTPKHSSGVVFADISSTFYVVQHRVPLATFSSTGSSMEPPFVPDNEEDKPLEEVQITSLHSTTLIKVPAGTDHIPISMLHLNLLHTMRSVHASHTIPDNDTLNDVTRNFHELAILTRYRWKLSVDQILPFHLAALEAISSALSRSDAIAD